MRRVIYLEVYCGLCNRIRALISGICLAEELKCDLQVNWRSDNEECRAGFGELFDPKSLPGCVTIIDNQIEERKIPCFTVEQALKAIATKSVIKSNSHFYRSDPVRWQQHLRRLQPNYAIRKEVIRNFNSVPRNLALIGVHIRRTDNSISIRESPLWAFKMAMRKIQNGYFYLASDDKTVVNELKKEFPGRVYCNETQQNRNTTQGMQEAVTSLYTLAHCQLILCSYWSSFSSIASSILSAKKQVIVKN